jgi:hypothetical protein
MKILFTDNSLWGLLNFRGCIITHLRDLGHEVVMVSPVDASSKGMSAPEGVRHIPIRMRRTSTNPRRAIFFLSAWYLPKRATGLYLPFYDQAEYIRYTGGSSVGYS